MGHQFHDYSGLSSMTLCSRDTLLYDAVPRPTALSGQSFDDRSHQLPPCWFYLTMGKTASNKLVGARLDRGTRSENVNWCMFENGGKLLERKMASWLKLWATRTCASFLLLIGLCPVFYPVCLFSCNVGIQLSHQRLGDDSEDLKCLVSHLTISWILQSCELYLQN